MYAMQTDTETIKHGNILVVKLQHENILVVKLQQNYKPINNMLLQTATADYTIRTCNIQATAALRFTDKLGLKQEWLEKMNKSSNLIY